jgi:glycosyltransferase involved in cell wall biosynthesis
MQYDCGMSTILTICVPTYNRFEYLQQCLASIEAATRLLSTEIEVLVSNNASPDSTSDVLNSWQFSNPKVKFNWVTQERNIGPLQNINYLVRNAEGTYLLWCSDDDFVTPNSVTEAIKEIQQGDIDFLRFALVVHDQPRNTLYLHALKEKEKNSKKPHQKFIAIYKLTHILTGTLVKREICIQVPKAYKLNIYPMAAWCALSFSKVRYSSLPFAIHTYGNVVHWGTDVEESSVAQPGNQSANDFMTCLDLVLDIRKSVELHKEIYRSFQGKYYSHAIKNLKFDLQLPLGFKLASNFCALGLRTLHLLRSVGR